MPRAFVFKEYGGPGTQSFVELQKPVPGPGELLVAVRAVGVNPADWKFRAGYMQKFVPLQLPAVFGFELAGVVEQLGEGVQEFAVGDEVFGSPIGGAYAEYALLPVTAAARKPAGVSFVDAATLPVAAATAYDGVHQLGLHSGQVLLVNGVGGGVGVGAAQIARGLGLDVIGTASPGKKEFVESLGVTHVPYGDGVADRIRAVAPDGVDAIYDLVGGDALRSVADLVKDPSKLITAVDPSTASEYGGGSVARGAQRRATVRRPALALAASQQRVFVIAADTAAAIDLRTLAVSYAPLRLLAAAKKQVEGSVWTAATLPDGRLVVSGFNYGATGSGVWLLNPTDWSSRVLDPAGSWFQVGGGLVFTRGDRGVGLRILKPSGSTLELLQGRSIGNVTVIGPRALVTFFGTKQKAAVIELSSGRVITQTVPARPLIEAGQPIVG
jgi:NADPH:quinone reductase-like Zn-dependent oxidoreductase